MMSIRVACTLWAVLGCLQLSNAFHIVNSYRIKAPGLQTEGSFQIALEPVPVAAKQLTTLLELSESDREGIQSLNGYVDIGEANSNLVTNGTVNCSNVTVIEYIQTDLNPSFERIQQAKRALKEAGYAVKIQIQNKSVTIITETLASATAPNVTSEFKKMAALYDWSTVLQEATSKQLLAYAFECPQNVGVPQASLPTALNKPQAQTGATRSSLEDDLGDILANDPNLDSNSSALSGLNEEQARFFNNSVVKMDWCGEPKCTCDRIAVDFLRNSTKTVQPPDAICPCYITTQYVDIDFEGFQSKAEIHAAKQNTTEKEVQEYSCDAPGQFQCLRRAAESIRLLQGSFSSWRTTQCLIVDNITSREIPFIDGNDLNPDNTPAGGRPAPGEGSRVQ